MMMPNLLLNTFLTNRIKAQQQGWKKCVDCKEENKPLNYFGLLFGLVVFYGILTLAVI